MTSHGSLLQMDDRTKIVDVFDPNQLCLLPDIDTQKRMISGYKARCRGVEIKTLKPLSSTLTNRRINSWIRIKSKVPQSKPREP